MSPRASSRCATSTSDAFSQAIQDLPLPPRTDRRALRLMLLGALNWSQTWYRPGKDSPQALARRFVRLLRDPMEP